MKKLCLLRYDTEHSAREEMAGFFEKVIEVHRAEGIPATFFCTGRAIEEREADFRAFYAEVGNDPLFDIQDHSYSHIGLGYTKGKSLDRLKADYERSFAVHERVFGKCPIGVSVCGTSGEDGDQLRGFDETEKGREEIGMMAELGLRMINSHLLHLDETTEFGNFAAVGHPEIMGFPSGYSDTGWFCGKEYESAMAYILSQITEHSRNGKAMPLMLHDWAAWTYAPDQELTHVKRMAAHAREQGYELATHIACYQSPALWNKMSDSPPNAGHA